MYTTSTLRGVFPEQKPVCRRNFIKENVKSIKQMQGVLQQAGVIQPRLKKSTNEKNIKFLNLKKDENFENNQQQRLTHRAIQTERDEDLGKLYDTGIIKYPTRNSKLTGQGDAAENLQKSLENFTIKEQKKSINKPGILPKYLRERKIKEQEAALAAAEPDCPSGHVLLPEEERKETLRVLRQSYADRIQELNLMPVRNDTLKMRKRKIEIEEELKRIDNGIKVFQRPKVFVKINA